MKWLMLQKLEHREQRIVLEELLGALRQESERVERLEQAIRDAVPEWSLAEVVTALQAMRGIAPVGSVLHKSAMAALPSESLSAMIPEPTTVASKKAVPSHSANARCWRDPIKSALSPSR
jgi:hypothetical protein